MKQFLLGEFDEIYYNIFSFISDEDIKSKFIGVCLLYVYGGIYSDAGNEPIVSVDTFIESGVDFITCNSYLSAMNSYRNDMNFNFNPTFMVSHKKNPILKNCLDWYVQRYETNTPYTYTGWNMMRAFTDVLKLDNCSSSDGLYDTDTMKIQILNECFDSNHHTVYYEYGKKRLININSLA